MSGSIGNTWDGSRATRWCRRRVWCCGSDRRSVSLNNRRAPEGDGQGEGTAIHYTWFTFYKHSVHCNSKTDFHSTDCLLHAKGSNSPTISWVTAGRSPPAAEETVFGLLAESLLRVKSSAAMNKWCVWYMKYRVVQQQDGQSPPLYVHRMNNREVRC